MPEVFIYQKVNDFALIVSSQSTAPRRLISWSTFLDQAVHPQVSALGLFPFLFQLTALQIIDDLKTLDIAIKTVKENPVRIEYDAVGNEDKIKPVFTTEQLLATKRRLLKMLPASLISQIAISDEDEKSIKNYWGDRISSCRSLSGLTAFFELISQSPMFSHRRHAAFDAIRHFSLLRKNDMHFTYIAKHMIQAAQARALMLLDTIDTIDKQLLKDLTRLIFNPEYLTRGISRDQTNAFEKRFPLQPTITIT